MEHIPLSFFYTSNVKGKDPTYKRIENEVRNMFINGADLRKMRLTAGMTTVQMAEFAGVKTRKTYENWEKNVGAPSMNQYLAMATACGFKPADLIKMYVDRNDVEQELDLTAASKAK